MNLNGSQLLDGIHDQEQIVTPAEFDQCFQIAPKAIVPLGGRENNQPCVWSSAWNLRKGDNRPHIVRDSYPRHRVGGTAMYTHTTLRDPSFL